MQWKKCARANATIAIFAAAFGIYSASWYTSALKTSTTTMKYDLGILNTKQTVTYMDGATQKTKDESKSTWDNCGTLDEGKKACASGKAAVAFSTFMFIFGIGNCVFLSVGDMPGEWENADLMADDYAKAKLGAFASSIGLAFSSLVTMSVGIGGLKDIVDVLNKMPTYQFSIGIAAWLAVVHFIFSLGCVGICYWWWSGAMPLDEAEEAARKMIQDNRPKGDSAPGAVTEMSDAVVAPTPAPAADGPAEKLKKLKELLDAGAIDQAEYDAKKEVWSAQNSTAPRNCC